MTSRIPYIIQSTLYNSQINKYKFISNKKRMNSRVLGVKYKQQNLSLIKRCFHSQNTENKRKKIPFFATLGVYGCGGGGGGGGNKIGPILGIMAIYSIYNKIDKPIYYYDSI
jgi:hypothetical protein